jgi:hypothetical protein
MCFAWDDAGQHRTVEWFPRDEIRELRAMRTSTPMFRHEH